MAGAAFVANLVPALGERGIAPETAAVLGGAIGVMQLPGRALLLHGAASASPSRLLTLSLLSAMTYDAVPPLEGVVMGVNYGFDKLRFLAPVPTGSNVRGRVKLLSAEDKGGNRWLLKHEVTVEIEGEEKPACVAETVVLLLS